MNKAKVFQTILLAFITTVCFGQIKATDPSNWEKNLSLRHPEGVKEVSTVFYQHNGEDDYDAVGEETFGFDEKGRLDFYIYVDYVNDYYNFELQYDYVDVNSDKVSKRTLYQENDKNPSEIVTYTYDEQYANLLSIKQEMLDADAPEDETIVLVYTYSYDEHGRLSKISASGVNGPEINASLYEYNHRGDLVSIVQTLAGDFIRKSNFKYDEKGVLTESSFQEMEDGDLLYKTSYAYDEDGNFLSQSVEGRPDWEVAYEFDDKKNWIKSESQVWDGSANRLIPYDKAIRSIVYR